MKKNNTIMVLGPPGVGKSTFSMQIRNDFKNAKVFSIRIYAQYLQKMDNELSEEINRVAIPNKIMPIETVEKIFDYFMKNIDKDDFIIFEGFPINEQQLELADKSLGKYGRKIEKILYLTANKETLKKRILNRTICLKCESKQLGGVSFVKQTEFCPYCGEKLTKRIEDDDKQFERRYILHINQIKKILDTFNKIPIIKVDTSNYSKKQLIYEVYGKLNIVERML